MPNDQLLSYSNQARKSGKTDDQIRQELLATGWNDPDISEAMGSQKLEAESSKSEKQKAPVFVRIISWFLLLGGLGYTLLSAPFIFVGGIGAFYKEGFMVFLSGLLLITIGVGSIVVSFGLRSMKRWALYTYTALMVVAIVSVLLDYMQGTVLNYDDFFGVIFGGLVLLYFWAIRKRFI